MTVTDQEIPSMRVLYCKQCKTIEELPDYQGDPSGDAVLHYATKGHPHGDAPVAQLYRIPIGYWLIEDVKKKVIKQIKQEGSSGLAEFDPSFYDTRNTLKEDAAKCYQDHLRPKGGCVEFRTDRKLLLPDTKAERKELGLPTLSKNSPGPKQWLCSFCPVNSYYENKVNTEKMKKGLL